MPAPPPPSAWSSGMFSDIVGSTELLSVHGDAHWRHELDAHDGLVDNLLSRYGGRRAKHTGDGGVFALFDGPTVSSGMPFRRCAPRLWKRRPEPADTSRTVRLASTSSGPARPGDRQCQIAAPASAADRTL